LWRARDGHWRSVMEEPPAFANEVVEAGRQLELF
jgi:hypothetical protein